MAKPVYSNQDLQNGAKIVNSPNATNPGDVTPLSQVQSLIAAAALNGPSKGPVLAVTNSALPNTPVYNNGTLGVGATLTATGNAAFPTIDGVAPALNNIYLIASEADAETNGIYQLVTLGSGSASWQLQRTTNFDQVANMELGSFVVVSQDAGADTASVWVLTTVVNTVGTDPITFTPQQTVTAGVATSISGVNTVDVNVDGTTIHVNGDNELEVIGAPDTSNSIAFNNTTDWSGNTATFSAGSIGLGTGPLAVYVVNASGAEVDVATVQTAGQVVLTSDAGAFAGTAMFVAIA